MNTNASYTYNADGSVTINATDPSGNPVSFTIDRASSIELAAQSFIHELGQDGIKQ